MTSIAIVGAGPSGCYLAQALAKLVGDAAIDIIDRLPVPYGLIRYGVAADHQGTKGVVRQFERLFERQGVQFFGNVEIGRDVSLEELRGFYDVVVLAAGLGGERRLVIPGEALSGVMGAGIVTRAWNDHPDAWGILPALGRHVVVMGNGNVALDLVRILAKAPDELDGSDLSDAHSRHIETAAIETIDVIGRAPAAKAKFDAVMLKELARLSAVRIVVEPGAGLAGSDAAADGSAALIEALRAIDGHRPGTDAGAARMVTFRFGWTPVGLEGQDGHVSTARFERTDCSGAMLELPCDSFLSAIGFDHDGHLPRASLIDAADDLESGRLADGLYAVGWFRRGPRGTIPDNRADAQIVAARIQADLGVMTTGKPGRAALAQRAHGAVDYGGWQKIDAAERAGACTRRCRRKIPSLNEMLALTRA
jgi:ferredoxin/flavodoxin---NADP+ reductase